MRAIGRLIVAAAAVTAVALVACGASGTNPNTQQQIHDLQATVAALSAQTPQVAVSGTTMPTAIPTSPAPSATVAMLDALRVCYDKLGTPISALGAVIGQVGTYTHALALNLHNQAAADALTQLAGQGHALNVSIQAISCDGQANEFLQLVKAGADADNQGLDTAARGAQTLNGDLLVQSAQQFTNSTALFARATALVNATK